MTPRTIVFYHDACRDGFAAAWAAYKALGTEYVQYIPIGTKYAIPPGVYFDEHTSVYVLDMAFPRETTQTIHENCKRLVTIDHHISNKHDLDGLDINLVFDNARSGAGLAWDYFHHGVARPWLIDYIEDRDLWRWQMLESQAINAGISLLPLTFEAYDRAASSDLFRAEAAMEGDVILRYQASLLEQLKPKTRLIRIADRYVITMNSSLLQSDIGNWLLERYPNAAAAAVWFQRGDGQIQWSVRSNDGESALAIAQAYGGGGHANSAGFRTSLIDLRHLTS